MFPSPSKNVELDRLCKALKKLDIPVYRMEWPSRYHGAPDVFIPLATPIAIWMRRDEPQPDPLTPNQEKQAQYLRRVGWHVFTFYGCDAALKKLETLLPKS
jgi:hypothetical protein